MDVVASSKYIRMSARKLRLVAAEVRGLSLKEAQDVLENVRQRAALPILLTLKQARGNAVNNYGLDEKTLQLAEIQIGEGPTYKRWRAVSRGRANSIMKRTAHVRLVVRGEKPVRSKVDKQSAKAEKKMAKKGTKEVIPANKEKETKRGTKN